MTHKGTFHPAEEPEDMDALNTSAKTNLTAAINEVLTNQQGDAAAIAIVNGKATVVPVTAFNNTIPDKVSNYILIPAGTLATGTLVMPANPVDGQRVRVMSSKAVTGLTHSANTGQTLNAALTTIAADGHAEWVYDLASTTWFRAG